MTKSKSNVQAVNEVVEMAGLDNTVHFVMQSKGGAGKSIASYLLAQFLKEQTQNDYLAYDTDPNNKTLTSYKSLNVTPINLINERTEMIDQSKFDILIEKIISHESPSVIDTGSGEFINIVNYINTSSILEILEDSGKTVYIHVIVNFGQSMKDTLISFITLLQNFPNAKYVIWKNEYYGYSETPLEEIPLIKDNASSIHGFVTLEKLNSDTHEKDFLSMIKQGLTFDDVIIDGKGDFGIINKSRLKKLKAVYLDQLNKLF
jgi:ATPases involved in chromosome partitioning